MNQPRPTWDQTWLAVAEQVAKRSLCTRAQVGAVITDPTNQYVVTSYNGPPAGWKHGSQPCGIWCKRNTTLQPSPDYSDCYTIHAETNALLKSDYTRRKDGTLYCTTHLCWGCAKSTANSGVARVVVAAPDDEAPHRDPLSSYLFLLECGLQVILPNAPDLTDKINTARLQMAASSWVAYPERLVD